MDLLIQRASETFVQLPAMEQEILTRAAGSKQKVPTIASNLAISERDVQRAMRSAMQSLFEAVNRAAASSSSDEDGAGV
jgi:DNA-directed RNA polymerase specialized sigma24 family protein